MEQWVPFEEGEYWIERAYLVTPAGQGAMMEQATIEVYLDRKGTRHLKGSGKVRNMVVVELLEESDDIHLMLDLGGEFKYRMQSPKLFAGKVFSPDVKSVLRFVPSEPWEKVPEESFEENISGLEILK